MPASELLLKFVQQSQGSFSSSRRFVHQLPEQARDSSLHGHLIHVTHQRQCLHGRSGPDECAGAPSTVLGRMHACMHPCFSVHVSSAAFDCGRLLQVTVDTMVGTGVQGLETMLTPLLTGRAPADRVMRVLEELCESDVRRTMRRSGSADAVDAVLHQGSLPAQCGQVHARPPHDHRRLDVVVCRRQQSTGGTLVIRETDLAISASVRLLQLAAEAAAPLAATALAALSHFANAETTLDVYIDQTKLLETMLPTLAKAVR